MNFKSLSAATFCAVAERQIVMGSNPNVRIFLF